MGAVGLSDIVMNMDFVNSVEVYLTTLDNPKDTTYKQTSQLPLLKPEKEHGYSIAKDLITTYIPGQVSSLKPPLYIEQANDWSEGREDTADILMHFVIGSQLIVPALLLILFVALAAIAHYVAQSLNPFPCDCIICNPPWINQP